MITTMSTEAQEILDRALALPPVEKARIVDQLLSSLDQPDEAIDALWRKEVEDRIRAYNAGILKSVSLEEVLAKYRK
jgi:putative addiction module component (TIGR02574 family)